MKLHLSLLSLVSSVSLVTAGNTSLRHRALVPSFPPYSQQCRDDAGPPFLDDDETFGGGKKYFSEKPAFAVGDNDCPDPLKGACESKPKIEAFLEGPISCNRSGWFCRILEQPGWPTNNLKTDLNFGYCNTTEGFNDEGFDRDGHCHGSDSDETFYWWVRDHWFRGYNGRLRCCCGWDEVTEGGIVNSCDFRRLVTPTENLEDCRDANEEGVTPFRSGCSQNNAPSLNEPLVEDDSKCWEVQNFGEPSDGGEDNDDNNNINDDGGNDDEEDNNNEEEEEEEDEDNSNSNNDGGDNDEEEEEEDGNSNDEEEEGEDEDQNVDDEEEESSNDENENNVDDNNDDDTCKDSSTFLFKNNPKRACDKMTKKSCNKKFNGKKVFKYCPKTCGKCTNGDEEDNSSGNDDGEESNCVDDSSFRFKGKGCNVIKKRAQKNPRVCNKKKRGTPIKVSCPAACRQC